MFRFRRLDCALPQAVDAALPRRKSTCAHCGSPLNFRRRIAGIEFCCTEHDDLHRRRRAGRIAALLQDAALPSRPLRPAGFLPLAAPQVVSMEPRQAGNVGWRRREPLPALPLPLPDLPLRLRGPIGLDQLLLPAAPPPALLTAGADWLGSGRVPDQRPLPLPKPLPAGCRLPGADRQEQDRRRSIPVHGMVGAGV